MEKEFRHRKFFFAAAVDGVGSLFEGLRREHENLFGHGGGNKQNTFGRSFRDEIGRTKKEFTEQIVTVIFYGDWSKLNELEYWTMREIFAALDMNLSKLKKDKTNSDVREHRKKER